MYECDRYLTFTGAVRGGRYELYERSEALALVHAQHLGEAAAERRAPTQTAAASMDDLAIVGKLFQSRAGQRIAALWTGNTAGYSSPSEADMALASYLAFYTQDSEQIRRLVAMSGLGAREKWQRDDYAKETIRRAIASRAGTYDPAWQGA
jgi:putative DNA primase/helicase